MPCFVDLLRVIKVAAGKGVCCKEKHLPRIYTEKRSKQAKRNTLATDEHGKSEPEA